jgi:hypothetical protein
MAYNFPKTGAQIEAIHTKVDGIETGATADQTNAQIKTAYEANADTNAVTDAESTVLGNTSGANSGDQAAGDFAHDSLATITGTAGQYNHPTNANMTVLGNTSNNNTGDQTTIVGISGTVAQFNTAISDATLSGNNTGDEVVAVGTELDTGTNDVKYASSKAIKDSKNVPSVAPGSSGNILESDGTNWTSAAPSGGGDVSAAAVMTDNSLVKGDGGSKGVQDSGILISDADEMTAVVMKQYNETIYNVAATGATETISLANGPIQRLTLDEACVITAPTIPTTAGETASFVLIIEPATFAASWAASPPIEWLTSDGAAPTLVTTAGLVNVVTFIADTYEGTDRWLGFLGGTETA